MIKAVMISFGASIGLGYYIALFYIAYNYFQPVGSMLLAILVALPLVILAMRRLLRSLRKDNSMGSLTKNLAI